MMINRIPIAVSTKRLIRSLMMIVTVLLPAISFAATAQNPVMLRRPGGQEPFISNQPSSQRKAIPARVIPPNPAGRYPALKIRAGEHGGFDRLVFDWNLPVNYRIQRVDDRMIIRFDRQAKADLSSIAFMELPYAAGIVDVGDNGGFALQIDLPAGAEIKDNRLDNKVVLDIIHHGQSRMSTPTDRAKAMTRPGFRDAKAPETAANDKPKQPVSGLKTPEKPELAPKPDVGAQIAAGAASLNDQEKSTFPAADFNQEKENPATPVPAKTAPTVISEAERLKVDPATVTRIRIDPEQPSAATVFMRGGYLWVVLDIRDLKANPLIDGPMAERLKPLERIPLRSGTAFRMPVLLGQFPSVTLDGQVWQITLSSVIVPVHSASVDISTDAEGAKRLSLSLDGARDTIKMTDPEVGDTLLLIPSARMGEAVRESRRFPQFEFLPSVQGAVVRPLVDDLDFTRGDHDMTISAPGGLLLSADRRAILNAAPDSNIEDTQVRLFDIQRWMRGSIRDFDKNRIMLQNQIADVPRSDEQIIPILELARLNFAHGFAPETSGLIQVAASINSEVVNKPEVMALRGAARALYGDGAGAIQDLSITAIANNAEASLWRGVAFARMGQWKRAADEFDKSSGVILSYPDGLYNGIAGLNVEALLYVGQHDAALKIIDEWQDRGKNWPVNQDAIDYLRGDILIRKHEIQEGLELWRKVADKGRDPLYGVKAAFGLIDYSLSKGEISRKEAIEKLERLRFAWRGDTLELGILRRLGNLKLDEKDYHGGMEILQRAVGYFPGSAQAEELTKDMVKAFNTLFIDGDSDKMSAIEAYGLYDQFRELNPYGPEGDRIIEKLADRLIGSDLLTEAGNILEYEVQFRLESAERARVATRLAGVRLLDNQPQKALDVLNETDSDVTDAAMRMERLLLRARAVDMDGKPDQALALLGITRTPESDRLRSDIAWRAGKWAAAAEALGRLIGDPPADGIVPDKKIAQMVINRAVALSLAADRAGLDDIRNRFAASMELTPVADTFRLLVRPDNDALTDVGRIQQMVHEVDLFDNFLSQYRSNGDAKPDQQPVPAGKG